MGAKVDHKAEAEKRERELIAEALFVASCNGFASRPMVQAGNGHWFTPGDRPCPAEAFEAADAFLAERNRQRSALA